jgi:hypothetical protein
MIVGLTTVFLAIVTVYMASTSQKNLEIILKNEQKVKVQELYDCVIEKLKKELNSFYVQIEGYNLLYIEHRSPDPDDEKTLKSSVNLKKDILKIYYESPKNRIMFNDEKIIPKTFSDQIFSRLLEYDQEVENLNKLIQIPFSKIPENFIEEINKFHTVVPKSVCNDKTGKLTKEKTLYLFLYFVAFHDCIEISHIQSILLTNEIKEDQIIPILKVLKDYDDTHKLILDIKRQKERLLSIIESLNNILEELTDYWYREYLIDLRLSSTLF